MMNHRKHVNLIPIHGMWPSLNQVIPNSSRFESNQPHTNVINSASNWGIVVSIQNGTNLYQSFFLVDVFQLWDDDDDRVLLYSRSSGVGSMVTGPGRKRKGNTGKFAISSSADGGGGMTGGGEGGSGGAIGGGEVGGGSGALEEEGRTGEKE
jgi:hypothetical protein